MAEVVHRLTRSCTSCTRSCTETYIFFPASCSSDLKKSPTSVDKIFFYNAFILYLKSFM